MPGNYPLPVLGVAADAVAPAVNVAAVVTYAANTTFAHAITGLAVSYNAAPAGGNLQIADGANVIFNVDITAAGLIVISFTPAKKGSINSAMTITLAAAGAAVLGKVSVLDHWLTAD